jgi:hypothetical protein
MVSAVNDLMDSDTDAFSVINDIYLKLVRGFYDENIVDAIFQKSRGNIDIYDAYSFAKVWAMLQSGDCFLVPIQVADTPYPDKEKEKNQKVFKTLPPPFGAEFVGGWGYSDGSFFWDDTIFVDTNDKTMPPGVVPLEVGSTAAEVTYFHIIDEGGVARLPYASNIVYLFLANPKSNIAGGRKLPKMI